MSTEKIIPVNMTANEAYKLLQMVKDDPSWKILFNINFIPLRKYLTTEEAAELIGCGRTYLHELVKKGIVKKARSIVGRNRYDRDEIQQLINEGRV